MPTLDSPNSALPPNTGTEAPAPPGGLGAMMGDQQSESSQSERRKQFQDQVQRLQLLAITLSKMEPGFAEASRQIIDMAMSGQMKVVGGMQEQESQAPYL